MMFMPVHLLQLTWARRVRAGEGHVPRVLRL